MSNCFLKSCTNWNFYRKIRIILLVFFRLFMVKKIIVMSPGGIKKQFSWQNWEGDKAFFTNAVQQWSVNKLCCFFYSDLLQGGEYYRSLPLDHGRHCLPHRLHFPVQDGLRPIQCRVSRHFKTRIKSEKLLINV